MFFSRIRQLVATCSKAKKEIEAVGLKDWWWFVVTLKRDEFSIKLSLIDYWDNDEGLNLNLLSMNRRRAHLIDMALRDLEWKK